MLLYPSTTRGVSQVKSNNAVCTVSPAFARIEASDPPQPASNSAATKVNTQRTVLYKLNVVLLKTDLSPKVILFHRTFSTMTSIMIQQIQENFKSYTHFVHR